MVISVGKTCVELTRQKKFSGKLTSGETLDESSPLFRSVLKYGKFKTSVNMVLVETTDSKRYVLVNPEGRDNYVACFEVRYLA